MLGIVIYLIALLITTICTVFSIRNLGEELGADALLLIQCSFIGLVAGVLYCLRAVYVHKGLGHWNSDWYIWYFLRPVTSTISGFASTIFLQAGMLALSSKPEFGNTPYGYYAIAFIAGYNVDFFMKKIEHIAKELWGIEKSRASREKSKENTDSDSITYSTEENE